jgi:hypothetical protein
VTNPTDPAQADRPPVPIRHTPSDHASQSYPTRAGEPATTHTNRALTRPAFPAHTDRLRIPRRSRPERLAQPFPAKPRDIPRPTSARQTTYLHRTNRCEPNQPPPTTLAKPPPAAAHPPDCPRPFHAHPPPPALRGHPVRCFATRLPNPAQFLPPRRVDYPSLPPSFPLTTLDADTPVDPPDYPRQPTPVRLRRPNPISPARLAKPDRPSPGRLPDPPPPQTRPTDPAVPPHPGRRAEPRQIPP